MTSIPSLSAKKLMGTHVSNFCFQTQNNSIFCMSEFFWFRWPMGCTYNNGRANVSCQRKGTSATTIPMRYGWGSLLKVHGTPVFVTMCTVKKISSRLIPIPHNSATSVELTPQRVWSTHPNNFLGYSSKDCHWSLPTVARCLSHHYISVITYRDAYVKPQCSAALHKLYCLQQRLVKITAKTSWALKL